LAVVGPGLIAGVAGNDAGGITTYATLGSQTGLRFLWILPLTALLLALVQESVARLGVVTGQGLSDLIRERFGVRWALFAMVVLLLANLANTVANVAGAASAMAIFNVPILLTAPLSALIVWLLVVYGSYRSESSWHSPPSSWPTSPPHSWRIQTGRRSPHRSRRRALPAFRGLRCSCWWRSLVQP
jgi:NRAMP (natural resistance-associated macrophage protein)-like metal ion transporter